MDDFFNKVYDVVKLIPEGRVSTYGAIANYLFVPSSARIVVWAMNNSHKQKEYIPAHRVVNRKGLLTGKHHFPTKNTMEELLKAEGVEVVNDKIVDFSVVFWDPIDNL